MISLEKRPLEVVLYHFLKEFRSKKFLLAVSGGADSMALLKAFSRLAPKLDLTFSVVHIHHGPSENKEQARFRDQCFTFLKAESSRLGVDFFSNIASLEEAQNLSPQKKSEAGMRAFRLRAMGKIWKQNLFDFVVFAHHADDLFETRLLRLIRGTGSQGLTAMSAQSGVILRPFLRIKKQEILKYIQFLKKHGDEMRFYEDPSNASSQYLRNWLRNEWLPRLEKKRPGSLQRFEKSLNSILEATQSVPSLDFCFDKNRLLRSEYLGLSSSDKRRVWATYLKSQGFKNYGLSHINELIKRLDVEQKDLTFSLLKKRWLANARHIWCESKNELE
jgi:tRNA(Ile)-lysidine synthase